MDFFAADGLRVAQSNARVQDAGGADAIDPFALEPIQRILLTADGTVTQILGAYYLEDIDLVMLGQERRKSVAAEELQMDAGREVLFRNVLLRGAQTKKTYVYAWSEIVPDRLSPAIEADLEAGEKSIGFLLRENRLETLREILWWGRERPAAPVAQLCAKDTWLVSRRYRVITGGKPAMIVTEQFLP